MFMLTWQGNRQGRISVSYLEAEDWRAEASRTFEGFGCGNGVMNIKCAAKGT